MKLLGRIGYLVAVDVAMGDGAGVLAAHDGLEAGEL